MKYNAQKLAITGGIVWALTMFVTTLAAVYVHYGIAFLDVMASIYPGYTISLAGSIIGAIYGFFDVFICIHICSWVYKAVYK